MMNLRKIEKIAAKLEEELGLNDAGDELIDKAEEKVAKEQLEAAKALAEEMKDKKITVAVKVGEGGRVFGSVSSKEIAEALKAQLGYDVDKKKILLDGPIKTLGVTNVGIKLHTKVTAEIGVHVTEA